MNPFMNIRSISIHYPKTKNPLKYQNIGHNISKTIHQIHRYHAMEVMFIEQIRRIETNLNTEEELKQKAAGRQ